MTYAMFLSTHRLIKVLEILAASAIAVAIWKPRLASSFFARVELSFHRIARQRLKAIVAAALFPLIVRALMLPWYPPPKPIVHDEFSYLLQADTFAHGRLSNPTPPYWQHFETEYTLLQPTYASQYQPAQGLMLAAGQVLLRDPWWGVWISVGIMCGAICWAVGFVLPAGWALFAALLAALQFGIFGIWMNSYFGGAVAATAGALVFGGIAAMKDKTSWRRCAMLIAFGVVLLFATRPFEAILWFAVAIAFGWWRFRKKMPGMRIAFTRLVAPFSVVFAAGAGMLAYYNWAITRNPVDPPYLEYRRIYGTPQPYWWQKPVVVTRFDYPELRNNYLNQVDLYNQRYSPAAILKAEGDRLRDFWRFFIGPFLTPALLFAGELFRDRRMRPWLISSVPFIADKATYHAWFPAHSGPATILIVLVMVQCWRHLRAWQRRKGFGIAVSRTLLASFCAAIAFGAIGRAVEPKLPRAFRHVVPIWESLYPPRRLRDDVTALLERVPGKHLLFVKYSAGHCFCEEWVFNGADPFEQKVVYVRPSSPETDEALIRSFKDFDAWLIEPDFHPYRLSRVTENEIAELSKPESSDE